MEKPTKKSQQQNVPVDEELKKILERQEQQDLLFAPDTLLPQRSRQEQLEQEFLHRNKGIAIIDILGLVKDEPKQCEPMFPRSKPFFKLMYKLSKWDHLNPNDFIKPPVVALWIKQYIYARFNAEVLPKLLAKDNPIRIGHIKKNKLYYYFDEKGLLLLEQIIKQAMDVMEVSNDWHDFELKYTKLYKLSVQLKLNLTFE